MHLYFITKNKAKFNEVKTMLADIEQLEIELPEIQEIDAKMLVRRKLLEALKYKKAEFIIEDTSLYLDCLNRLPGPLIKWFIQAIGNKGLFDIADRFDNDKAEARTIIGYARGPTEINFFEGSIKGRIVSPRGRSIFGWDPVFQPEGFSKTFAEMTQAEKNFVSMRRIALDKLKEFICSQY